MQRYLDLSRRRYRGWYGRALILVGFLPLLFLLASCGGGSGGGGGGGQGTLSVDLAFTPGDSEVTVNLVEKGPLVRLLNISSYQLTAIDSADETMRIEGDRIAEGAFNGSTLRGLTNDRNYTFALSIFYFPAGSAELSNLSLRIDYAEEANSENDQDAGGITIGSNWDGDYLADSVDSDDDNDGLDDVDATSGETLDACPRGDTGWRSNGMTDNDGDGCRDEGEDRDDDNDNITDDEDLGEYKGRLCHLFADCDNDTVLDAEDLGEFNGMPCRVKPDCDADTIMDVEDNCPVLPNSNQADGDGDGAGDSCDLDADGDGLIEIGTDGELNAVRWVLNGTGRRMSETAALDQTGCANSAGNEDDCHGYELVRDISLAAYAGGSGWAPLGRDTNSSAFDCQGTPFSGVFDGNGWTVRELSINRSGEDCVGLFGHLAAATVIRNLTVRADSVIGRHFLGGLVGWGDSAEIVASSSVVGSVSGDDSIGGLMGSGEGAEIVSSSSVVGSVSGSGFVGGLVGWGDSAEIVSSSSVVGSVSGSGFVGGLVGWGDSAEIVSSSSVAGQVISDVGNNVGGLAGRSVGAEIVSSSSVAGEVSGNDGVGGLVGWGEGVEVVSSSSVAGAVSGFNRVGGFLGEGDDAEIVSSSSVAGSVSGFTRVGGLVGDGDDAEIVSSSSVAGAVSGNTRVGGLVGSGGAVDYSYWNTTIAVAGNDKGESKTLAELRTPTNDNAYDASSIYANWADGASIAVGDEIEDITIYCDEDLSGAIEAGEMRDGSGSGGDNRIWDFGGTDDYPAIRCLPLSLAEQRSWWFINNTGHPNVNRDRLDALTSP